MTSPTRLGVRLLGPVDLIDEAGKAVPLPGDRLRALVALLAIELPHAVSFDRIIDVFWGDTPVNRPELALQVAVSRLRKAAGADIVLTEPHGYRLGLRPESSDVTRFRRLVGRGSQLLLLGQPADAAESIRQALAQFRGPPLSDLRSYNFAEEAARRLEEEQLVAVELLMEAELAGGNHRGVTVELGGLTRRFPLRERLWSFLMLALYRSGRQAEALRAYQELRSILGEELGVDPSPPLRELEERILMHDPALAEGSENSDDWEQDRELIKFDPGAVIVEEGSSADSVYWIEDGRVEVLATAMDGSLQRVAELGPGRYFGELAALLGTQRTATVRALTATVVSVHSIEGFRRRLGSQRAERATDIPSVDALRDLMRRGEYLRAFDGASRMIDAGGAPDEALYLAVLALARSGATDRARHRFEVLGLAALEQEKLEPRLAEDIAALDARLDKDLALSVPPSDRGSWARHSAKKYTDAFARFGSGYLAGNAATMALLGGDLNTAEKMAGISLAALAQETTGLTDDDSYWSLVTEAEAALVLRDLDRASSALAAAAKVSVGNHAARASTAHQLRWVCRTLGTDESLLDPIVNPPVVHYCGHRSWSSGAGLSRGADEDRVAGEVARVLEQLGCNVGTGSLAAGADILVAEALLSRGAELHVVLPCDRERFVELSVAPAGKTWVERFRHCLEAALSVDVALPGEATGDPITFDYAAQIAMGEALIRARHLETTAHQVAIWDGGEATEGAGTAIDVSRWRRAHMPGTTIPVHANRRGNGQGSPTSRSVKALVFGDFAGFSRLTDQQVHRFQEKVMSALGARIADSGQALLSGRTWGDGFYLVFDTVSTAAHCSLSLQEFVSEVDFAGEGLGAVRGLRLAAHAVPVFDGWDPISDSKLFFGAGVTQAARIEPNTPEGEVYVTKPFAAIAMLEDAQTLDCQYVGTVPTAKQYGPLPLFSLRRGTGVHRTDSAR